MGSSSVSWRCGYPGQISPFASSPSLHRARGLPPADSEDSGGSSRHRAPLRDRRTLMQDLSFNDLEYALRTWSTISSDEVKSGLMSLQ